MKPTIKIAAIVPPDGDRFGFILYQIAYPDGSTSDMIQPFLKGGPQDHPQAWGWDGNIGGPTLRPSYLCTDPITKARVHLHLTQGRIELFPDSTVELA